ncbi:tyrosine-type recombinase/integrase [Marinomonas primoryensis]|uniref:tyrosine-type recombinase/integrase n=1 Tax=Marinomonas primoryensis TaxID=178399 RepID=UPI0037040619
MNKQPTARRVFFMTPLLHATREGETSLAEWKHFSSDMLEWYLPAENTKNGTEHRLPITQHAMDLINSLPKRGTYIFSVKGIKPITTRTIERWYQSLSDDVGIKFTSHDIRKLARDSWQDNERGASTGLSCIQKWGNATQPRTGRTGQTLHAHPFERTDAQSVGGVGE